MTQSIEFDRIFGISGGAIVALAFALAYSSRKNPETWGLASSALDDFQDYFRNAQSTQIRSLNTNPLFGIYNLKPLKKWVFAQLNQYLGNNPSANINFAQPIQLSSLAIDTYLGCMDQDGTFTIFGPPFEQMTFQYHHARIGPPEDSPILDALGASLSTVLSTEPASVNGTWYRDCRPAIADSGAIIADLLQCQPEDIIRTKPHVEIRPWNQNWITSSFIMHSQNERNQTLLASYYLDLLARHKQLQAEFSRINSVVDNGIINTPTVPEPAPRITHIDLPYVGSTEAFTNMRQSVENKSILMSGFENLLNEQLDKISFDQPTNVLYGAGGFSGILAGLVTTHTIDNCLLKSNGTINHIYGVSAGVLNGFFHAIKIAANKYPDLYTPAARNALNDLEDFISTVTPKKIAMINFNPAKFWKGWANLKPLEEFLLRQLHTYTGSSYPEQITFDDIGLAMTVTVARRDGFTDFLGMATTDRQMQFSNHNILVRSAPVVQAMIAGWSMNTYILPTRIFDQSYTDGGGTFYDPAIFIACMDPKLTSLINIHLDEPEGHSYNLPARPNLVRILFDTHNYIFPEERRRMRLLSDLLYEHFQLRIKYSAIFNALTEEYKRQHPLHPDFRRNWEIPKINSLSNIEETDEHRYPRN